MATRILLVEDEPSIADNIVYALSTEGFAAEWTRTGGEALAALARAEFALVILDVGLPDANGFDLAREIRRSCEVPLIFVTARAHEIDRIVGLEIGADDYVVKPFSPRELTARVKAVLRRTRSSGGAAVLAASSASSTYAAPVTSAVAAAPPAPAASGPASRGPFVIDEDRHRITYHGQALELSRLEFKLLALLARRPGQVFSREALMNHCWDGATASMERTVDTHMKMLRQKLRVVRPDEDPIVTHRGVGYALREPA